MSDIYKQAMTNHFKVFKSQMEYLVEATTRFTAENKRSPFGKKEKSDTRNGSEAESFDPILPPVDYDDFESALGPLLTESGGLSGTVSGEQLCKLVHSFDMTPERRSLVIEILKNTRTAYSTNGFLSNGLPTLVSWLQITTGVTRDGLELTQIEHILEYLSTCSNLLAHCDTETAKAIQKHSEVIGKVLHSTSGKYKFVVGFDHQVAYGTPLSQRTQEAAVAHLKTSIQTLFESLMILINPKLPVPKILLANTPVAKTPSTTTARPGLITAQKKNRLSKTGNTSTPTSSSGGSGGGESSAKRPLYKSIIEDQAKRPRLNETSVSSSSSSSTTTSSQQPRANTSHRPTDSSTAPDKASASKSPASRGGGSANMLAKLMGEEASKNSSVPSTASSASSVSSSDSANAVAGGGGSGVGSHKPLMNLPHREHSKGAKTLPAHVTRGISDASKHQQQPQQQSYDSRDDTLSETPAAGGDEESAGETDGGGDFSFSSFTEDPSIPTAAKKVELTSMAENTAFNTKRRKIRWGDESEGGQLSHIKEFETLPAYQAPAAVPSIILPVGDWDTAEAEEEEKYQGLLAQGSGDATPPNMEDGSEHLSYSALRKRERAAERQGLKHSKQVADRKRLESLLAEASRMHPSAHWKPPSAIPPSRMAEEVLVDSKENKLQSQRISKKAEVVYLSDKDIPSDPEAASAQHAARATDAPSAVVIPWWDVDSQEPEQEMEEEEEEGVDDEVMAGLSCMPEYVTLLTEDQLGILIEKLSEAEYSHLLQDTTHPGFLNLVEEIAPGTTLRYLSGMQSESSSVSGGGGRYGSSGGGGSAYDGHSSSTSSSYGGQESYYGANRPSQHQHQHQHQGGYQQGGQQYEANRGGRWRGGNGGGGNYSY